MSHTISILIYTHSEYSFLWSAMIPLLTKYTNNIDIHWLYNENANSSLIEEAIPKNWHKHTYSEDLIWTKRVLKALNKINNDYILFLHEDWLPIGNIDNNILYEMITFMNNHKCGFLLSYSHISTTSRQKGIPTSDINYSYYQENNHVFQPAIWDKAVFTNFCSELNKSKHQNEDNDCLQFMSNNNCWSVQNTETVTTLRTTNSFFYPHMHAMSEGLWNFTKYPQLKDLLNSFNIDTNSRGVHSWWELDSQ